MLNQHPASPGPASTALHARTAEEILALLDTEGPLFGACRHIVPDWLGNRAPLGDGKVRALISGVGLETSHRAFLEHYFATARALGISRVTLYNKLRKYRMRFDGDDE